MGSSFPVITPQKLIRILQKEGFYVDRTKGSHALLKHSTMTKLRITIPIHNKDLKRGTLKSILRQAEISIDKFKTMI